MPPPAYRPKLGPTLINFKPPTPVIASVALTFAAPAKPSSEAQAIAQPAKPPVAPAALSVNDVFFEVYRAPSAGPGWRWSLWSQSEDGRALLVSMAERNHETQELALANLEAFKRLVASAPTRRV